MGGEKGTGRRNATSLGWIPLIEWVVGGGIRRGEKLDKRTVGGEAAKGISKERKKQQTHLGKGDGRAD